MPRATPDFNGASDEQPRGPKVPDTWITSQQAVNAFRDFSLTHGWVFEETPEQSDFGKDGYLNFAIDGSLTGQCVAVQIKGGRSLRSGDGWIVPADERRRALWRDSTVPVFGILWDPDAGLHWADLTGQLQSHGLKATLRATPHQSLDGDGLTHFLDAMWRSTGGPSIALALGSEDPELQSAAAYDIYGLGRRDARYLVLLRRAMFGLHPEALDTAIWVLDHCSIDPDNFVDTRWISQDVRILVRQHFRWTVDEAVMLLDRARSEDAFSRGSFEMCIYWLLVGTEPYGDHHVELVERALFRAEEEHVDVAAQWALMLRVYWAGTDGPAAFERLIARAPRLLEIDIVRQVQQDLADYGRIEVW